MDTNTNNVVEFQAPRTQYNGIIEKVEVLFSKLAQAGGFSMNGVASSLSWSYAMSMAAAYAQLERLDSPFDPEFSRMNPLQREDRRNSTQARLDHAAEVLAWLASLTSPDLVPTGEQIAQIVVDGEPRPRELTNEEQLADDAALAGMTVEELRMLYAQDSVQRAKREQLTRMALKQSREGLVKLIDYARESDVSSELQLDLYDAVRITERLAAKCELYMGRKVGQLCTTLRPLKKAALAAEIRLIRDVMETADELEARYQHELDASPSYNAESARQASGENVEAED